MIDATLTFVNVGDTSWQDRAACKGKPTEWWFPDAERGDSGVYARGREVCVNCPVRGDCLQWAVDNHQRDGMWGGLSPNERRAKNLPVKPVATAPVRCSVCDRVFTARNHALHNRLYCSDVCARAARAEVEGPKKSAQKREERAERLAAGLCAYCGKREHRPNVTSCQRCADQRSAQDRAVRAIGGKSWP